jgi:hypothetical protein
VRPRSASGAGATGSRWPSAAPLIYRLDEPQTGDIDCPLVCQDVGLRALSRRSAWLAGRRSCLVRLLANG